jgi:hypothetical protein
MAAAAGQSGAIAAKSAVRVRLSPEAADPIEGVSQCGHVPARKEEYQANENNQVLCHRKWRVQVPGGGTPDQSTRPVEGKAFSIYQCLSLTEYPIRRTAAGNG